MILDDLFSAAAEFDTDKLAAVIHPDIRFSEMPNLINPEGTERGFQEAMAGFHKGRELKAHIATFTQVRDGRIFRHATYDCYEPI